MILVVDFMMAPVSGEVNRPNAWRLDRLEGSPLQLASFQRRHVSGECQAQAFLSRTATARLLDMLCYFASVPGDFQGL
jgi:hypothetical protein